MKIGLFIIKVCFISVFLFYASSFVESGSVYNLQSDDDFLTDISDSAEGKKNYLEMTDPVFIKYKSKWVDSVFNSLSLDEKISQLIMVATYSNMGPEHRNKMENIIKKYKIGGLIFFQGSPVRQAQLTNYYQGISSTPLLIAMDAEWSISMRLDSTVKYPRQMMMGAVQDDQIIYDFGLEVGRQCRRLGVHVNFAPVVDINNNPRNPVINSRSFGESRMNVARKGFAYMAGMQEKNVIATAKHFPGHGDTESDSHHTLPVISHSRHRLDSLELFPFKYLIDNGLTGIMIAHLHIPAFDSSFNLASSLSYKVVTQKLKHELRFNGLVFTDALGMKGVSSFNSPGDVALKAFMAGTDILLMPPDIEAAIRSIKNALSLGLIAEQDINEKCYKVLQAKKWVGLDVFKPIETNGLIDDLNSESAKFANQKIVEHAITLVENKNQLLPLKQLDKIRVASLNIGSGNFSKFQKALSLYDDVKHFSIDKNADMNQFRALTSRLADFDVVLVAFTRTHHTPSSFGLTGNSIWFVHELARHTKVVINVFASPYVLDKFKKAAFQSIIVSYEDSDEAQDFSAQLIYGGIPARGRIPVSAGIEYPERTGIEQQKIRLKYAPPKEVNIEEIKLQKIDSIVLSAIEQGAMPGCQILAAKNGVVFFSKSYGYHTYEKKNKVTNHDIYDLASITKIAATLPILMKLFDEGKIGLNDKLSQHLPELLNTNKKDKTIRQVLAHQAGLVAWIPFYLRAFVPEVNDNYRLDSCFFSKVHDSVFQLKVAENLFMNKSYVDSIYKRIYNSPVRKRVAYRYSDLGFYLFYKMINDNMGIDFTKYLYENFYQKLGATTLCFNPIEKFPKGRMVPTEDDSKFRKQLVQGYVHDYGAAMMGGVCGHAGLFANANDLAKLMQMFLQKGEYGQERFLLASTLETFASSAYTKSRNRRALGFDKPGLNKSPVSKMASMESFGHTGFTGTIAWVDPKEQFVFIFLSNRIHPQIENNKLSQMAVRHKVHEVFYQSFL
jgi:beta-N-acetylhexosaminidase